jgi:hypothetical protein
MSATSELPGRGGGSVGQDEALAGGGLISGQDGPGGGVGDRLERVSRLTRWLRRPELGALLAAVEDVPVAVEFRGGGPWLIVRHRG